MKRLSILGGAKSRPGAAKSRSTCVRSYGALSLRPGLPPGTLVALYGAALSRLLELLAGITAVTALVMFLMLGRSDGAASPLGTGDEAAV